MAGLILPIEPKGEHDQNGLKCPMGGKRIVDGFFFGAAVCLELNGSDGSVTCCMSFVCLCGDRLEMRAALGPFIATVPLCWRLLSSAHVMSYSRMDKEMPISKAVPSSWLRFFCLPFWLEPNYRLLPQRFVYGSLIRRQLGRLIKSFCCWITRRDRCIRHFFFDFFRTNQRA